MPKLVVFRSRHPEMAYKGLDLWLPKTILDPAIMKANLELTAVDHNGEEKIVVLWKETRDHLLAPREYLTDDQEQTLVGKGVLTYDPPPTFEEVSFQDKVDLRKDDVQPEAWDYLSRADKGVLVLACGRGKTVLGCKRIAQEGKPAIVIAAKGHLLLQWKTAFRKFLGVREKDIGWVQGNTRDWDKPLVLATLQTISKHADKWPVEFRNRFGIVIFDEVHGLAAPEFSRAAPVFAGKRFGLTATPERADGLEAWYYYQVGRPFYINTKQVLEPDVQFLRLETSIDLNDPDVKSAITDVGGEFNFSRFLGHLVELEERNNTIVQLVRGFEREGRKVLLFSHLKKHLRVLGGLIPRSVIVTGETDQKIRLDLLRNNRIVLATIDVAGEGIDDDRIDTVIFATPFAAKRPFVQGMGRALRPHPEKLDPKIVVLEDYHVPMASGPVKKLRGHLDEAERDYSVVYQEGEGGRRSWSRSWRKENPYQRAMNHFGASGRAATGAHSRTAVRTSCSERATSKLGLSSSVRRRVARRTRKESPS